MQRAGSGANGRPSSMDRIFRPPFIFEFMSSDDMQKVHFRLCKSMGRNGMVVLCPAATTSTFGDDEEAKTLLTPEFANSHENFGYSFHVIFLNC